MTFLGEKQGTKIGAKHIVLKPRDSAGSSLPDRHRPCARLFPLGCVTSAAPALLPAVGTGQAALLNRRC